MKKILLLLTIVLFANSCGNEYYENPMETYVRDFYIEGSMWRWDEDELYFYCDVNIPELTNYVIDNGVITTFYVTDVNGREVLYPLPYDYYDVENGFRWTEQSTCEISPGKITFITKYNDFQYTIIPPNMTFLVKMMWQFD